MSFSDSVKISQRIKAASAMSSGNVQWQWQSGGSGASTWLPNPGGVGSPAAQLSWLRPFLISLSSVRWVRRPAVLAAVCRLDNFRGSLSKYSWPNGTLNTRGRWTRSRYVSACRMSLSVDRTVTSRLLTLSIIRLYFYRDCWFVDLSSLVVSILGSQ